MSTLQYPAALVRRGFRDWTVTFRDVPEAKASASSLPALRRIASEELASALNGYLKRGVGIPGASERQGSEVAVEVEYVVDIVDPTPESNNPLRFKVSFYEPDFSKHKFFVSNVVKPAFDFLSRVVLLSTISFVAEISDNWTLRIVSGVFYILLNFSVYGVIENIQVEILRDESRKWTMSTWVNLLVTIVVTLSFLILFNGVFASLLSTVAPTLQGALSVKDP